MEIVNKKIKFKRMLLTSTSTTTKRGKKTQLACLPCQRSHYSCDNERPCGSCLRKNRVHECVAGATKKHRPVVVPSVDLAQVDWQSIPVDLSFTGFDWWIISLQHKSICATNSVGCVGCVEEFEEEEWMKMALKGNAMRKNVRGREFHVTFITDDCNLPIYVLIYELPTTPKE